MNIAKELITKLLHQFGYRLEKITTPPTQPESEFHKIIDVPGFLSQNAFNLFEALADCSSKSARLKSKKILEIGVYCGRSLLALGLIYKHNIVIVVDPFYESFYKSPAFPEEANYLARRSHNQNADTRISVLMQKIDSLGLKKNIELQRKTQESYLNSAKKEKFKLIYIDGEHSYKSINFFLNCMSNFLVNDSFLVIDDVLSAGYPGIAESIHRHSSYKKTLFPISYAFNKGVFIYKPGQTYLKNTLLKIENFAKTNKKTFRKSDNDNAIVIFE